MILRTEFLPDEKIVIGTATRNLKNHIIADRFIAKPAKKKRYPRWHENFLSI
jgi:hypothetical protein